MPEKRTNPKADFYFVKAKKWQEEIETLREILLTNKELEEDLKWGVPCYLSDKKNIVLIHVFKDYCALLFFKGVLLKDTKNILVQQTENVQAARQVRFTNSAEIIKMESTIKSYVSEAIKIEKAGLKVELKQTTEYTIPEEFKNILSGKKGEALQKAFNKLTPGRQRAYILYFSAAKQTKTRIDRIEKAVPQIMSGKGLND